MNKRPVKYLQTDARWKSKPYKTTGENTTIGGSGCGPTCAAMLIETLTGKTTTPVDTCNWSMEHGYKALGQGTYYSYFKPQFAAYGIACEQLNNSNLYGKSSSSVHDKAFQMLKQGYYIIACMGKGLWTSSGHFVVVWWEDGKVRINDPASTKDSRENGDLATFKSQVKYYWAVDARAYNNPKEDEEMTQADFDKMFATAMVNFRNTLQDNDASAYSEEAREWAKQTGLVAGNSTAAFNGMWEDFLTREQFYTVLYRFAKMLGKA